MRPDAFFWRNTNHLDSLEFSPGRLIYNRIPKWISTLLLMQVVLGTALWCALRSIPCRQWVRGALGETWVEALCQPGEWDINHRFHWLTKFLSGEDVAVMLLFVASQLAATLIVQLIALPLVRRRLRQHVSGLKDVFDAIRGMATGVMPKPMTAGGPGEAGFLALAFNDLMARLTANKKELIEANQTLERKVDARTQELRDAALKLEKMALMDPLTGLANRRALMDEGERKFNAALRDGSDLIFIAIDLDNFKAVNDTLGHAMGDELIRLAADTLRHNCRADDLPARLGGDEFLLIMTLESVTMATTAAQRLQSEFRSGVEAMLKEARLEKMPSMSIGITSRKSSEASSVTELMKHADTALYQAKTQGKARAQVYFKGAA